MPLEILRSVYAIAPGRPASFLGSGGTEPYTYSVLPGGAGGSINASTGWYTGPTALPPADRSTDTIRVTDDDGATADASLLVTSPLGLVAEIVQREMGLADGRVYFWDQKILQPNDSGLYVALSIQSCKPFGISNRQDGSGSDLESVLSVNMLARLQIDMISRGPEARDRKEEVLLALASNYARSQQALNSFFVGKLPAGEQFINLSNLDGSAIPYRFVITLNLQYFVSKTQSTPYYDDFEEPEVNLDPEEEP